MGSFERIQGSNQACARAGPETVATPPVRWCWRSLRTDKLPSRSIISASVLGAAFERGEILTLTRARSSRFKSVSNHHHAGVGCGGNRPSAIIQGFRRQPLRHGMTIITSWRFDVHHLYFQFSAKGFFFVESYNLDAGVAAALYTYKQARYLHTYVVVPNKQRHALLARLSKRNGGNRISGCRQTGNRQPNSNAGIPRLLGSFQYLFIMKAHGDSTAFCRLPVVLFTTHILAENTDGIKWRWFSSVRGVATLLVLWAATVAYRLFKPISD